MPQAGVKEDLPYIWRADVRSDLGYPGQVTELRQIGIVLSGRAQPL